MICKKNRKKLGQKRSRDRRQDEVMLSVLPFRNGILLILLHHRQHHRHYLYCPPPPSVNVGAWIPSTFPPPKPGPWYRRSYCCGDASANDDNGDSVSEPELVTSPLTVSPRIALRNTTIDDRYLLLEWDEKEHLQGSYGGDPDFNDWNWEYELRRNDLSWRYQLIAQAVEENHTVPIGFVQIIDPLLEETHYWGMDCEPNLRAIDIWIGDERYLNRGYGTHIMKQILRGPFVFGDPNITGVVIDPMADNCAAHRFYQRLGFQPIGIRYFGPDRCLVHRMYRSDSNYY